MNLIHQQGQYGCYFLMNHSPINFLIFIYMKYIISESRLDTIMKNYLDSSLLNKEIIDNQAGIAVYDDEEDYLQYFPGKRELFILKELLDEFEAMFGLTRQEAVRFITNWFENEFYVKVHMAG